MPRLRRSPRRAAVVLVVVAGVLSMPHGAHAGQAPADRAASARPASSQPIAAQTLAAASQAASGGLCSVPGIGDIGGLRVNIAVARGAGLQRRDAPATDGDHRARLRQSKRDCRADAGAAAGHHGMLPDERSCRLRHDPFPDILDLK